MVRQEITEQNLKHKCVQNFTRITVFSGETIQINVTQSCCGSSKTNKRNINDIKIPIHAIYRFI